MAIINIASEQLDNSEGLEKIKNTAQELIIHEEMSDAWNLAKKLETQTRDLIDSSPEIYKQYQKIIAQLKFVAIPFLTDEQVFNLIENHFLDVLKGELDIKRKIEAFLIPRSIFIRDQFKKDIISYLKRNREQLENKTIGEWLVSYDDFAGARRNTNIERARFITKDPVAIKSSEESKNYLLQLLELYDNLKIDVPVPIIGVSEITLKEYFEELGIPLEEEKHAPLPIKPIRTTPPPPQIKPEIKKEVKKEIELTPLDLSEKPKKPGFFQRLFKRRTQRPEITEELKEPTTEIIKTYEKTISPYEKKRELFPVGKFKPKLEQNIKETPEEIAPETPLPKPRYHIRTMKTDIDKVKQEPAPPGWTEDQASAKKPVPKVHENIVDLSEK